MSRRPLQPLLRHLLLTARPLAGDDSDCSLLTAVTAGRDEAAFAALLGRHGPWVWGLCRRLLGDVHAAEDAFQATFLVLAREAGAIRRPDRLGCWLYGVARRISLKARAAAERRRAAELPETIGNDPDPADAAERSELRRLIAEELAVLPEKYQAPLILCHLQGRTHREAADALGWPSGSLSRRMTKAVELLRDRLVRRGVTLAVPALTAALAGDAAAAAPRGLAAQTLRLAGLVAEGTAVPASVLELADGAVSAAGSKLAWVAVAVAIGLGTGAGVLLLPAQPPSPAVVRQSPPEPSGEPLPQGTVARLGTTKLRHANLFGSCRVTFSPDGLTLATAGDDGVRFWDAATGRLITQYPEPLARSAPIFYSPDGRSLLVIPGTWLKVMDITTGRTRVTELQRLLHCTCMAWSVAWSPNGRSLLAAGQTGDVALLDAETLQPRWQIKPTKAPSPSGVAAAFGTDGRNVVTLCGRTLTHRDAATGAEQRSLSIDVPDFCRQVLASPDGRFAVAVSREGTILLWDAETGKALPLPANAPPATREVAFAHKPGTLAAVGTSRTGNGVVAIWNVKDSSRCLEIPVPVWLSQESAYQRVLRAVGRPVDLEGLAVSPDGTAVAVNLNGPAVGVWDVGTGKRRDFGAGHEGIVTTVTFASDGRTLVSGGSDHTVRRWHLPTGRPIDAAIVTPGAVQGLAALPGSSDLIVTADDGVPRRFADGREARLYVREEPRISADPLSKPPITLALSTDGKTLAQYCPGPKRTASLNTWDAADGRPLARRTESSGFFSAVFSPDLRLLAGYDNTLKVCEVDGGRELFRLPKPDGFSPPAVFSPDGRQLVVMSFESTRGPRGYLYSPPTLRVYEVTTGRERLSFEIAPKDGPDYRAMALAPDGLTLAVAHPDRRIQLWDLTAGRDVLTRAGFDAVVASLAFSADGRRLASGHADGTIHVWDVTAEARPPSVKDREAKAAELESWWAALAGADAREAHAAILSLTAAPGQAIPWMSARLRPAEPLPAESIPQLIADLDSDRFAVREAASRRLTELGEAAEAALQAARENRPSAEMRQRIDVIVNAPRVLGAGEELRGARAVEVLERVGTPEARRLLERLAGGAPGARLTREAKAALQRLVGERK